MKDSIWKRDADLAQQRVDFTWRHCSSHMFARRQDCTAGPVQIYHARMRHERCKTDENKLSFNLLLTIRPSHFDRQLDPVRLQSVDEKNQQIDTRRKIIFPNLHAGACAAVTLFEGPACNSFTVHELAHAVSPARCSLDTRH